jgi:hypothetical protein
LRPLIRVGDALLGGRAPAPERHLQRVDHQLGADVVGDRPPDDAAAPGVEDDGQVGLALAGGVLGETSMTHRRSGPSILNGNPP